MTTGSDLTRLLIAARTGAPDALSELFERVYAELRSRAHQQLAAWRAGDTLSTTALVHETYLKLVDSSRLDISDRQHFLAIAARAMRQIVIDAARRAAAEKRGGGLIHVGLDAANHVAESQATDVVALEDALTTLEQLSPRLARLVELRFYGGLSVEETAAVLAMSPRTVKRDWRKARAFLFREVFDGDGSTSVRRHATNEG